MDNPAGDYGHLQRSLDTLRSLSERNVDFRLNLNQDLRNIDLKLERYSDRASPMDRSLNLNGRNMSNLELNLSLERGLSPQDQRHINIDSMRNNLNLDRSTHIERELVNQEHRNNGMPLERCLSSERLSMTPGMEPERVMTPNSDRLGSIENRELHHELNELKYREYKNHLDCLRGINGRVNDGQDEERGTPSTPPTPVSVGENNYHEDKVILFLQM